MEYDLEKSMSRLCLTNTGKNNIVIFDCDIQCNLIEKDNPNYHIENNSLRYKLINSTIPTPKVWASVKKYIENICKTTVTEYYVTNVSMTINNILVVKDSYSMDEIDVIIIDYNNLIE